LSCLFRNQSVLHLHGKLHRDSKKVIFRYFYLRFDDCMYFGKSFRNIFLLTQKNGSSIHRTFFLLFWDNRMVLRSNFSQSLPEKQ